VGEIPLKCELPYELGVGIAGVGAGEMVEMGDVEGEVGAMMVKEMQEGDAVGAAGDGDGIAAGWESGNGVVQIVHARLIED
jgi:hypothetical protein